LPGSKSQGTCAPWGERREFKGQKCQKKCLLEPIPLQKLRKKKKVRVKPGFAKASFYEYFKEPAYNIRLCIYRVVQELIHNVIKHASASRLDIQIVKHRDRIVLTVEDDGAGFDMQYQKTNGNGLGLRNIETRVSSLSGTVEIDSAPGKGTLIIVEIPLNQP